ncbi:PREDICTED: WRKY transcription factor 22-like [Nicotiana attenuata]|uniref:Wrky transcription factor 27 n=1 Tax=Nicotiana attenuata TaxID=49451 RepID=A0A1J6JWH5_NICAT|nr:PREDICTED: WRKY transcription factor 22-like [Nicotiana attenuata]OIT22093.1 putative wrky transcription factor 27 [Nicotiana attenuata]
MGDNNWNLGAVVRSYNIRPSHDTNKVEVPSLGLESLTFENDDDWNFFHSLLDVDRDDDIMTFECLTDIFSRNEQKPDASQPSFVSVPIADEVKNDQNHQQLLLQPIQLPAQQTQPIPPPSPAAAVCVPAAAPQQVILQKLNPCPVLKRAKVRPTITVSIRNPIIQIRRRKNQPEKTVYEVSQEELIDFTWAWRKYGQKPIKGSLFPRNYFRCSTSKDCDGRKHIEKSPRHPNLFIVAYSGEHNHPPPANRCTLSDSTNSKPKSKKLPKGINIVPRRSLSFNSSSSNDSGSRPISPNMNEMVVEETKADNEEEEEKVVPIPNNFMTEDIIKSSEELNGITTAAPKFAHLMA